MREASEDGNYDTLVAQVTKARVAGCLLQDIEKAEAVIKKLKSERKHINEGCDHETLQNYMTWEKVTDRGGKAVPSKLGEDYATAGASTGASGGGGSEQKCGASSSTPANASSKGKATAANASSRRGSRSPVKSMKAPAESKSKENNVSEEVDKTDEVK
ncbi:unnamed protein product, partial [Amoebophrya sp. A25]|eukprot:GSA25T00018859001.1